jgi:hypothetical protein
MLCKTALRDCTDCIYYSTGKYQGCNNGENKLTFTSIEHADTPEEKVLAFYNRAQHIRKILEKIDKEIEPFKVVIDVITKEQAQALYAIFNHTRNSDLLQPISENVRMQLSEKGDFYVHFGNNVIANGITYDQFYKNEINKRRSLYAN